MANQSNAVDAICGPEHRGSRLSQLAYQEGQRCLGAAGIEHVTVQEEQARRGNVFSPQAAVGQPRKGASSWQSLARKTGTIETDYLNGEIVLLGRLHGVPTPVNSLLQQVAREHAKQRSAPGTLHPNELLVRLADA